MQVRVEFLDLGEIIFNVNEDNFYKIKFFLENEKKKIRLLLPKIIKDIIKEKGFQKVIKRRNKIEKIKKCQRSINKALKELRTQSLKTETY